MKFNRPSVFYIRPCDQRRGAILVLAAVLLAVVFAMVVFAIDVGYLLIGQTDLQRAADAAAHAAVLEFRSDDDVEDVIPAVRAIAARYAEDNKILNASATLASNPANADADGDTLVGRIDLDDPRGPMSFADPEDCNAVRVRIQRTDSRNGEVKLFFAAMFGFQSVPLHAEATAAIIHRVAGFRVPHSGENVPFLPITIQIDHWNNQLAVGNDAWTIEGKSIHEGPDGSPEAVLFPRRTGSGGNFGTVNIGISANSTSYISNQIRNGLSQSDLDYHGGELALNDSGELMLSGNPGISAAIKDDLKAIAGQPVVIPLYREVTGNGNNAQFTIVRFTAVRVMAVKLTGGEKAVVVQPAKLVFKGVVQAPPTMGRTSERIYSPPVLVK